MKAACILLFIVSVAISALAQDSTAAKDCPDVLIGGYAWGVTHRTSQIEDPTFKADSSGRRLNTKDNPINTVGNPINIIGVPVATNPVRPQGDTPSQSPQAGRSETIENVEIRRETYVQIKNLGDKTIKTIDWDYVFFTDPALEHEVKRHKFHSKKKIAPGQVKFLSDYVNKPPGSKYQKVFVNRVVFSDGTICQKP